MGAPSFQATVEMSSDEVATIAKHLLPFTPASAPAAAPRPAAPIAGAPFSGVTAVPVPVRMQEDETLDLAPDDPRALLEKLAGEAPADPPAAKDGASPPPTPAVAPAPDPPSTDAAPKPVKWRDDGPTRDVPAPPKAPVRPAKGGQPVQGQLYGRFTKK